MSSNEIVKKIIEEDKQQQIKPIGEPESYLTSFKGIQRFLANECQNLGKSRPSKPLGVADLESDQRHRGKKRPCISIIQIEGYGLKIMNFCRI